MNEREVQKAELRRLIRNIGMLYSSASHKAHNKQDPFAIYHFAQAMAYEECINIIKRHYSDEMKEEDWV